MNNRYISILFIQILAVALYFPAITTAAQPIHSPLKVPGTLGICYYTEFKPISYGNAQGFEPDLLRAIAKLWQIRIKFYPETTYEGIWRRPSDLHSPCDIAAGGMSPEAYRQQEGAAFSVITASFKQSLLVRKKDYESGRITSYQSFRHTQMKIGVVPGTTGEQFAHLRAQAEGLTAAVFKQYPSESELLPALRNGNIDAIARGEIGNEYQSSLSPDLVTIAKKDFKEGFALAVASGNKKLLLKLDHAIREVTDNHKITYPVWLKNHDVFMQRVGQIRAAR